MTVVVVAGLVFRRALEAVTDDEAVAAFDALCPKKVKQKLPGQLFDK